MESESKLNENMGHHTNYVYCLSAWDSKMNTHVRLVIIRDILS